MIAAPSGRRPRRPDGARSVVLGVRPEQFRLLSPQDERSPALDLLVDAVEDTGAVAYLHATAQVGGVGTPVVVRLPERSAQGKGARVRVAVRPDRVHCFSAVTGARFDVAPGAVPVEASAADTAVAAKPA